RAVDCGAVPILIELVNSGLERAVEVLGLLAKSKEGREGMMRFDGCVEVLATVLKNGTSRGVQYALLTMNSLCCCSEKACLEALKDGVFEICVEKLEDDNEKVRRNAKSLIQFNTQSRRITSSNGAFVLTGLLPLATSKQNAPNPNILVLPDGAQAGRGSTVGVSQASQRDKGVVDCDRSK
ncbi:unnamed protein product, partial [Ilex paraguariensis]